jgi:predicted aminopeptidase
MVLLAAVALLAASCSHIRYYGQAVRGGTEILAKRQPIEWLLENPEASGLGEARRKRLQRVLELRDFASAELGLPDNKSYRTYVEIDRPYVVWNVVAAPEFSILPRRWCFPIAGCVSYRGYFARHRAERFAAKLERQGFDVSVGGVTAYSTLGWFADPVLSTFIDQPEARLAGLLFHELAHQVAYAPGDTTFNESFATVVEIEGVGRWLRQEGDLSTLEGYLLDRQHEIEFVGMALGARARLAELYASDQSLQVKRQLKQAIFDSLKGEYAQRHPGSDALYTRWFEGALNNSHLAAVSDYHRLEPPLAEELARLGGDLPAFYERVAELAALDQEERWRQLGVTPADELAAGEGPSSLLVLPTRPGEPSSSGLDFRAQLQAAPDGDHVSR